MNMRISAMVDGEASNADIESTFRILRDNAETRQEWEYAHLIGDAMRGEKYLSPGLTGRVMEALEDEPTVLAPPRRKENDSRRMLLSLAASAAGVAVVGWVALGGSSANLPKTPAVEQVAILAAVPPAVEKEATPTPAAAPVAAPAAAPVAAVASPEKLHEYLVAHHARAPMTQMAPAAGGVRSVAMVRAVP